MNTCPECGKTLRSDNTTRYCYKHTKLSPIFQERRRKRETTDAYRKKMVEYRKSASGKAAAKRASENWKHSWKGKEYRADAQIRKLYGITLSDKRVMYINQDYRCKLCKFPIEFKVAHIDHDHKTGKIRGILCSKCNNGLGFFGDNPKRLREAADYLER